MPPSLASRGLGFARGRRVLELLDAAVRALSEKQGAAPEHEAREDAVHRDTGRVAAEDDEQAARARALVPAILKEGPVDAIVSLTGRHAAGAAAGLREAGLRIPADTMVVAASDSAQTRFGHPAISALEHPHREIGNALVEMLHDIISGRPPEAPRVLQTIYHLRASTARDVV
ncbi:substrate-binding domain-containing protein [Microbacterium barkeri]|uniref:substrate-binding domain-containing protein n=1 Tax=Microbacterium barkeri TaxID=33917 RepID=UPI0022F27CF4|nr:substrate-binding domain-containing protein [Microbacterium barkeri]MDR6877445.1 DNA-binding LacI/PurR family transcriptional regulator [Microbacterium barkeri]